MAKLRNRIELNKTNKQLCGQLDILCDEYKDLETKADKINHEFDTIKNLIKSKLNENADFLTTKFKIVMSITEAKTEFKYDIEKILKKYPEIKENEEFGSFKEKAEVKRLSGIDRL